MRFKILMVFMLSLLAFSCATDGGDTPDQPPTEELEKPMHFDAAQASFTKAQMGEDLTINPTPEGGNLIDWLQWIWGNLETFGAMLLILLMFWEPIVRLTPTEKDNNLLRTIQSWIDRIIPNRRIGGENFTAYRSKEDAPPIGYVPKQKSKVEPST